MELLSGPVAALTLVVLWSFEAIVPGIAGPAAGLRQRCCHLLLGFMNAAVSAAVVGLLLLADTWAQGRGFGLFRAAELPWWVVFLLALAVLDVWHYTCHVLAHQIPLLWRFHAVHHNADKLEATVAMRFHCFEIAFLGLLTIPVAVLFGIGIQEVAAYNLILLPVSLFHHSNVRLSPRVDRVLRLFIVTPRMHWLHHSRWQPETNSNYSSVFSIWDRIFGTFRSRKRAETVEIGLDGYEARDIETLRGMMTSPFGPTKSEYGERPDAAELEPDDPLVVIELKKAETGRFEAT